MGRKTRKVLEDMTIKEQVEFFKEIDKKTMLKNKTQALNVKSNIEIVIQPCWNR